LTLAKDVKEDSNIRVENPYCAMGHLMSVQEKRTTKKQYLAMASEIETPNGEVGEEEKRLRGGRVKRARRLCLPETKKSRGTHEQRAMWGDTGECNGCDQDQTKCGKKLLHVNRARKQIVDESTTGSTVQRHLSNGPGHGGGAKQGG